MVYGIVPPFLLERLARSPGVDLGGHVRATLELDTVRRAERAAGPPRPAPVAGPPGPGPRPRQQLRRIVSDAGNTTTLPGTVARAEGDPPTEDPAVDEAYRWMGASYEFYLEVYGRNSINDAGEPLEATVHYGEGYDNAFWTGRRLVYGDGDGEVLRRLTRPIGITGHELTHGVIQYTAGLGYSGQTGALNESVADVFASLVKQHASGETAEQADWLVGEGIFQPRINGVALRSLAAPGTAYDDPLIGQDPQPATMAGYVETSEDDGGVHINSGIPNHAFYLIAVALGGHAWERAGRIWYDTLTGGALAADADFVAFARATVKAAEERYGASSAEVEAVRRGWTGVGIET